MSEEKNKEPKIISSDEDWKQQAKKEKDKLVEEQEQPEAAASAAMGGQEFPPAGFMTLVNSFAVQAMLALGRIPDPRDGKPHVDLGYAKYQIDTLQVLLDKTKGNLTDEETQALSTTLHELRMIYVQAAQN